MSGLEVCAKQVTALVTDMLGQSKLGLVLGRHENRMHLGLSVSSSTKVRDGRPNQQGPLTKFKIITGIGLELGGNHDNVHDLGSDRLDCLNAFPRQGLRLGPKISLHGRCSD